MKRPTLAVLAILLTQAANFAQTGTNVVTANISFQDELVYYENDPVLVKVTIKNETPAIYRFRLADSRAFSVNFSVQNLANQGTPPSEPYMRVMGASNSVFTRDVSLRPGEEFSFVENLNDYRKLAAGVYVVTGYFYPELMNNANVLPLQSNRLTLTIRPDSRRTMAMEDITTVQVQQILKAQALPPDQVIAYMLNARVKDLREQFMLYIDAEALYVKESFRADTFKRMSEPQQRRAIEDYRDLLWAGNPHDLIGIKPVNFEVKTTNYDEKRATVEVVEKFKTGIITEVKLFKYRLTKKDGIWFLTDYSVTNKGSE